MDSSFESVGDRVLIEDVAAASEVSGLVVPDEAKKKVTAIGVVVSSPESPRLAPGDVVIYRKYAADLFRDKNEDPERVYCSVFEEDVIALVPAGVDLGKIAVNGYSTEGLDIRKSQLAQENREAMITRQKEKRSEMLKFLAQRKRS